MSRSVGAYEAKTHFAQLLDEVETGQAITITRHGAAVAQLVPATRPPGQPAEIVEQFRQARRGLRLNGVSIRELIDEGRQ
ncbi:MAG: type II toxin-antitoxin system prevent-host-death family antitoxin [Bifidobacteriaceae bacterium]|jgi:prevent-host-death family protein|nr:type II toxin-antitoxin system prevent-host-death family antitoxin [Bifidobacteriaceae bacterium]